MRKFLSGLMVLLVSISIPVSYGADNHIVSTSDLQHAVQQQSQTRAENLAKVQSFFSSRLVIDTLKGAKVNSIQIRNAVSTLTNEELARLASQTQKIQNDVAGGGLTHRQVTYVIIAVTIIIVIAILAAD
jgi:hypothetical protein